MPEWDEKNKKWVDWAGSPVSDAQRAAEKRTREYIHAKLSAQVGPRNVRTRHPETGDLERDPGEHARIVQDRLKGLDASYFGTDPEGSYLDKAAKEKVARIAGESLIGAEKIRGQARVDAARAGEMGSGGSSISEAIDYLRSMRDPGRGIETGVEKAVDIGAENRRDQKKRQRDAALALPGNVLDSADFSEATTSGSAVKGVRDLWRSLLKEEDPDRDSWRRDAFR